MVAENLLLVSLSIVLGLAALFICCLEAREVLGAMRNVKTTINRTLQRSPHSMAHASSADPNVQNALEGPLLVVFIFDVVVLTIELLLSLELLIQAESLQDSSGQQEPGGISRRIVLMAGRDAKASELVGRSCCNHDIPPQSRIRALADAPSVGKTNHQAILPIVELILVLANHLPASMVVRLPLSPPPPRHLEPLEVGRILQHLHKRHGPQQDLAIP
mmetsp:Transcript_59790/g.123709  ORF Transcript_59790/g.123709 Transcript_59790/m.123709 type:complete len:218 (-) Transcript_59790:27-680(-)